MPTPLAGPGQGLPLPQNLYPSLLQNAPLDSSSNRLGLAAGDAIALPAGDWYIAPGMYCVLQYLDPVTGIWTFGPGAGWVDGVIFVKSDGFNYRIANLTGCPVTASITNSGGSYVQATTTIASNVGGSTWLPIIGGAVSMVSFVNNGAGHGVAPLVFIPPPPPAATNSNGVGGVQASGYAVIAGGTLSTISLTNPGSGYGGNTFTIITQPSPFDPNLSTGITNATVIFTTTGSGQLMGAICTNNGAPLTAAQAATFSLTVSGAGTNATLSANIMQTVTAASVTGAGIGYGNALNILVTTTGGAPATGTITNTPEFLHLAFRPRPAQAQFATTGAGGTVATQVGTVIDGGLFLSAPTPILVPQGIPTTIATTTLIMGSSPDFIHIQPGP